ncbi:MAG: nitrilase-related carbon-nitrogen hydrolase [Candidatus Cloacimonadota bacterium]|nr:nitrilase-related carbon-nitrogen hydrolase [Candidatus Cloacimonadota bacterium]
MKYKIGVCQFEPKLLDLEYNRNKMQEMVDGIKADLIVFPELATGGYVFKNHEEVDSVSEPFKTGQTAKMFKKIAKRNDCSYVIGYSEKEGDDIYNSAMLINPGGQIYNYRKIHLFYEEKIWFKPGNTDFKVLSAKKEVRVGMMVCFDWIFPESARTLMLKGAQVLAHPANLVLPWCQEAMKTRCLENRVFAATCNRIGTEKNGEKRQHFTGMSQITDTKGRILKRLGENEERVYISEVEIDEANDKNVTEYNHIISDRRPNFYD